MLNWKGTLVLVPGSGSLNKLGVKTELESKVNGFFLSWMSLRLKVKADHHEYFLYSWGHSLRHSSYYGGPQLSRQKQKPHGKTENLTAKAKTSRQNQNTPRQNQNTPRQNQKPHGKTIDLTQNQILHSKKPNTPRQKQIPTAKPKSFCSLWSIWFCRGIFCLVCREVFCFCREVFVFAVTRLWATIQLPYDTKEKRFNRDRKR